jgi:transcriptional regulator with XRE-family HTH domain
MKELSFGAYIRQLREDHQMPLRKLAAALDIDTSTLSKIERHERHAHSNMVPIIAEVFDQDYKELQIFFWADKLFNELKTEAFIIDALKRTIELLSNEKTEKDEPL